MVPQQRTRTERIVEWTTEERTREVPYTEMVAKQVERQFEQVTMKPVTEEKVVTYIEQVPETVERQVQVAVRTMVPGSEIPRTAEAPRRGLFGRFFRY